MKTLKTIKVAVIALLVTFTACQKDDVSPLSSSNSSSSPAHAGTFKVNMTDAPGDYAALDVEISGIEAYNESAGWVTLSNELQHISVLQLTNGAQTTLAYDIDAEAGVYSKLKLKFGEQNMLTLNAAANGGGLSGNGSAAILLQWDGPREVVIDIDEKVSASAGAEVLLDFQVVQSIKQQAQQYIIDPLITEIKDASTGLKGRVEGTAHAAVIISSGSNELSTYIDASGNFLIRGIDDGVYDLVVIPEQRTLGLPSEKRIENIIISKGEIKQVGTISF